MVRGLEMGTLFSMDMSINLGGGLERGHYFFLHGDARIDEDLAGSIGTTVANLNLTEASCYRIRDAVQVLRNDGAHTGVRQFKLVAERTKYGVGFHTLDTSEIGAGHESSGDIREHEGGYLYGHALPRRENYRRAQMRLAQRRNLRAGVVHERVSGTVRNIYWTHDVEALLLKSLYMNGYGGYAWTRERGVCLDEHIEKRLWSINPMFRDSPLFVSFMFDLCEKLEVHRLGGRAFLPDEGDENDANEYSFMSESSARGFETICRKDLSKGRRGVASTLIGKPNIFQTETMNEKDMEELSTVSFKLTTQSQLRVDEVSLACLYKIRQIVIIDQIVPRTGMKWLEHGLIRLEVQSGSSYRLHAHNMLRVEADEEELFKCISASLSSLNPIARVGYEPVARHRCVAYKCKNGICSNGYPVLEASDRTYRENTEQITRYGRTDQEKASEEGKMIYKREVGVGEQEKDERVTPFSVELSSVRICHGSFMVCTNELATGYAGKYSFKRSGGLSNETGQIALSGVVGRGDVQLMRNMEDGWMKQATKEKLGVRIVSMMELCLHLCKESIVYSTYLRELWIVLLYDRKKFLDNGVVRKGIAGGAQLRDYYARSQKYETDTFQKYYQRGSVPHVSDYEKGIRTCSECYEDSIASAGCARCLAVLVEGKKKRIISRIMPLRGSGKQLVDMCCWSLILRNVPHRRIANVWDISNKEHSWGAAARSGALGSESCSLRNQDASVSAVKKCVEIEQEFAKKIGMTENERDKLREYFEDGLEEVLSLCSERRASIADQNNPLQTHNTSVDEQNGGGSQCDLRRERETTTGIFGNLGPRNDSEGRFVEEDDETSHWGNRFRRKGWKVRNGTFLNHEGDVVGRIVESFPPVVCDLLAQLTEYPSQARCCLEIIDAVVTSRRGLRRFISGAAGRGKSFLKSTIIKILTSVGLNVKVIAVAAIVAQDDCGTGRATIASAFNMRGVSASRFDELSYEHSQIDVFILDEVSLMSVTDGRAMSEYFARGEYLRMGAKDLSVEARQSRREMIASYYRNAACDPWFGTNLIVIGDFMQLGTAGGESIQTSKRLWGFVFRRKTLFLEECVHSSYPDLMRLCGLCRNFVTHPLSIEADTNYANEVLTMIRSREINSMIEVDLDCTVLSPRFQKILFARANEFCTMGLQTMSQREEECKSLEWGTEVFKIFAEDYVVSNRKVKLEVCVGMDDGEVLEEKRKILDKDHTRLREFTFRIGMIAVVTENGTRKRRLKTYNYLDYASTSGTCFDDETMVEHHAGQRRERSSYTDERLLNGERVKIVGVLRQQRKVIGVRVRSYSGRWTGEKVVKMTPCHGEVLRKPSILEGRTVQYVMNGAMKVGKLGRHQVPLVLEMALTVHKAQCSTLSKAVVDMGRSIMAYVGGLFYTAITRVRSLSNLWFIALPDSDEQILKCIRSSAVAKEEMDLCREQSRRLQQRSNLLLGQFSIGTGTS